MLAQLKFDCYKILHSWMMRSVLIVGFVICMVYPIATFATIASASFYSHMVVLTTETFSRMLLCLATVLFTVFLVGMDFSSGYMKNIYSSANKVAYIFSKVICVLVFVIVFQVLFYLISMLSCLAFCSRIIYEKPGVDQWHEGDVFNIRLVHYSLFAQGSVAFVYAMAIMFLLLVTKNQWAALIVGIIYLFLGEYVHELIDVIISEIFRPKNEFHIDRYLILQSDYFYNVLSFFKIPWKDALLFSGMMTFYSLLAIGCSFPIFMKRKVKV